MRMSVIEIAARDMFKNRFGGTPEEVDEDWAIFHDKLRKANAVVPVTDREEATRRYQRQYMARMRKEKKEAQQGHHN